MTTATLIKETISLGLAYSSEVWSIIVTVEGRVAYRQIRFWRANREFYIWIHR